MQRLLRWVPAIALALALTQGPAFSQQITGAINGVVRDNSGAVLPATNLTATNVDTALEVNAITDETGGYTFPLLRPGRYRVSVEKQGFQRLVRENVVVNTSETLRLDLDMQLGAVTETVTVTAQTPLLQSEQATLGHVVEGRTITSIPLATRNFTQILGTSAGVVGAIMNADNRGTGSDSVSVNGARRGSNNLLVDGVPTTNQLNNAPDGDGTPSIEFLNEFKVLTSLYSAEYGRNLGSVINVTTRSGTNSVHGMAYEFLRNTEFNARPFFFPERRPNNQNQFGANVGGPIRRDKTFFFAGWESSRQRNGNGGGARLLTRVPTAEQRAGNFGDVTLYDPLSRALFPNNTIPASRINGTSKSIADGLIPLPNFFDPGIRSNFQAFRSEPTDLDQYTVRIDHRFGDKTTLNGRWFESFQEDLAPFGRGLPGMGNLSNREKHTWGLTLTRIFSPSFVMEMRASGDYTDQYTAGENKTDPASLGLKPIDGVTYSGTDAGPPRIIIDNYMGSFGNFENWSDYIDRYAGGPTFTWTKSRHVIKFGYEHHATWLNPQNNLAMRGQWQFRNFATGRGGARGDEYADFLLSQPTTKLFGGADVPNIGGQLKMRSHLHSGFINDDWKIKPNFTLNIGVRYEADFQAAAYNVRMTNWWPHLYRGLDGTIESTGIVQGGLNGVPRSTIGGDWNNFQPRIGLAWRVSDKWVIRAGGGLYFDLRTGQVAQSMFGNPPVYTRIDADCQRNVLCNLDTPDDWTYLNPGHREGFVPFPTSPTEERVIQGVERITHTDNALQYNLAIQRELPTGMLAEVAYIGTKGSHLNGSRNANPLVPVNGLDAPLVPGVQLRRQFPGFGDMTHITQNGSSTYHSLQGTLKQRLNSTTFQLSYTFGKTLGDGDDGARYRTGSFQTPWNQPWRGKGPASFDRTHRVSFVFNHDVRNMFSSGVGKHLFNNWSVNGFLVAQTGTPLTVVNTDSGRGIGGGLTSTTATNIFANVNPGVPLTNAGSAKDNLDAYINPDAFSRAPVGTFGNSGRGMFRGPGQWNLDFSAFKEIPITERWRVQFRTEFFNIFNHANFGNPNNATSTVSMNLADFGSIRTTTVNARLVQFALKVLF
ncbi:MAG: carboxypeptidase regulatory-like domain-containing protein [Bryobacteraceae bacterium]